MNHVASFSPTEVGGPATHHRGSNLLANDSLLRDKEIEMALPLHMAPLDRSIMARAGRPNS